MKIIYLKCYLRTIKTSHIFPSRNYKLILITQLHVKFNLIYTILATFVFHQINLIIVWNFDIIKIKPIYDEDKE